MGFDLHADRRKTGRPDVGPLPLRPPGIKRGVRFTSNIVGPIYLLADILCLLLSAPLALIVYDLSFGARLEPTVHLFAFVIMVVSFLLLRSSRFAFQGTLSGGLDDEGDATFNAVVATFLTAALVWQFGLIDNYSRGISIIYLICLITCLWLSRPILRRILFSMAKRGVIGQRIAFYGADPASLAIIERMLRLIDMPHLRFVGVADDRPKTKALGDLRWIGGYKELADLARKGEIDQVFISVADINKDRLKTIVEELSEVSIDVSVIPPQAVEFSPDYRVNLLGSIPVLTLWQRPFRDINQIVKRGEDLLIGGAALFLASPILLVAALLIRATSKGPILFVQPRVGFNNEVIQVIKFRSMYDDQTDLHGLKTTSRTISGSRRSARSCAASASTSSPSCSTSSMATCRWSDPALTPPTCGSATCFYSGSGQAAMPVATGSSQASPALPRSRAFAAKSGQSSAPSAGSSSTSNISTNGPCGSISGSWCYRPRSASSMPMPTERGFVRRRGLRCG